MNNHRNILTTVCARPGVCTVIPWCVVGLIALGFILVGNRLPPGMHRPVHVTFAAIHESLFDLDGAILHLDKISTSRFRSSDLEIDIWRNDLIRKRSLRDFLSGKFADAASGFETSLIRNPGDYFSDYFSLLHLAISRHKLNDSLEAIHGLNRAIDQFPNRQDAYILRGHLHLSMNDILSAEADYIRAKALAEKLGSVYVDIGDAYRAHGNLKHARNIYQRGAENDPGDPFILLRLAEAALFFDHNRDRARELSQKVRRILPVYTKVGQFEVLIDDWHPGDPIPYISTAVLQTDNISQWIISPSKILFEYFRDDWQGYDFHE